MLIYLIIYFLKYPDIDNEKNSNYNNNDKIINNRFQEFLKIEICLIFYSFFILICYRFNKKVHKIIGHLKIKIKKLRLLANFLQVNIEENRTEGFISFQFRTKIKQKIKTKCKTINKTLTNNHCKINKIDLNYPESDRFEIPDNLYMKSNKAALANFADEDKINFKTSKTFIAKSLNRNSKEFISSNMRYINRLKASFICEIIREQELASKQVRDKIKNQPQNKKRIYFNNNKNNKENHNIHNKNNNVISKHSNETLNNKRQETLSSNSSKIKKVDLQNEFFHNNHNLNENEDLILFDADNSVLVHNNNNIYKIYKSNTTNFDNNKNNISNDNNSYKHTFPKKRSTSNPNLNLLNSRAFLPPIKELTEIMMETYLKMSKVKICNKITSRSKTNTHEKSNQIFHRHSSYVNNNNSRKHNNTASLSNISQEDDNPHIKMRRKSMANMKAFEHHFLRSPQNPTGNSNEHLNSNIRMKIEEEKEDKLIKKSPIHNPIFYEVDYDKKSSSESDSSYSPEFQNQNEKYIQIKPKVGTFSSNTDSSSEYEVYSSREFDEKVNTRNHIPVKDSFNSGLVNKRKNEKRKDMKSSLLSESEEKSIINRIQNMDNNYNNANANIITTNTINNGNNNTCNLRNFYTFKMNTNKQNSSNINMDEIFIKKQILDNKTDDMAKLSCEDSKGQYNIEIIKSHESSLKNKKNPEVIKKTRTCISSKSQNEFKASSKMKTIPNEQNFGNFQTLLDVKTKSSVKKFTSKIEKSQQGNDILNNKNKKYSLIRQETEKKLKQEIPSSKDANNNNENSDCSRSYSSSNFVSVSSKENSINKNFKGTLRFIIPDDKNLSILHKQETNKSEEKRNKPRKQKFRVKYARTASNQDVSGFPLEIEDDVLKSENSNEHKNYLPNIEFKKNNNNNYDNKNNNLDLGSQKSKKPLEEKNHIFLRKEKNFEKQNPRIKSYNNNNNNNNNYPCNFYLEKDFHTNIISNNNFEENVLNDFEIFVYFDFAKIMKNLNKVNESINIENLNNISIENNNNFGSSNYSNLPQFAKDEKTNVEILTLFNIYKFYPINKFIEELIKIFANNEAFNYLTDIGPFDLLIVDINSLIHPQNSRGDYDNITHSNSNNDFNNNNNLISNNNNFSSKIRKKLLRKNLQFLNSILNAYSNFNNFFTKKISISVLKIIDDIFKIKKENVKHDILKDIKNNNTNNNDTNINKNKYQLHKMTNQNQYSIINKSLNNSKSLFHVNNNLLLNNSELLLNNNKQEESNICVDKILNNKNIQINENSTTRQKNRNVQNNNLNTNCDNNSNDNNCLL